MPSTDFEREVLKDTVFRFAPETQELKRKALDEVVKNSIHKLEGSANRSDIVTLLSGEGSITISPEEINKSLNRLDKHDDIGYDKKRGQRHYYLTGESKEEVERHSKESDELVENVLDELTRGRSINIEECEFYFTDVLAYTFTELGEESISVLGVEQPGTGINSESIMEYCDYVTRNDPFSSNKLKEIIIEFFDTTNPHFNKLKWKYAQNFFIAKSMGIDYGESVLGSEAFDNAVFYIDTNVSIPALETAARLNKSFQLINDTISQIDADLYICTNTIYELNDWANDQYGKVKEAINTVPPGVFEESYSLFSKVYKRKKVSGTYSDPSSLFENFNNPEDILARREGVEVHRNGWFVEAHENDRKTQQLVEHVRSASRRKRGQDKDPNFQALHDALLIRWAIHQRDEGLNAWILTADTSLPAVEVPFFDGDSLVVTMDALLQWLSPAVRTSEDLENFQEVFSDLIRSRLLPQDAIFTLDDLNIFAQLGMSVKDLFDSDVKKCLNIIKDKSYDLDLSDPEDRETMMHEVRKTLSSPDMKYKKRLKRKEKELKEKNQKIENLSKKQNNQRQTIEDLQKNVGELKKRIKAQREENKRKEELETLKSQAIRRISLLLLIVLIEISGVAWLGYEYSSPDQSVINRILEYSGFLGVLIAITIPLFTYFIIDKKHLRALGILPSNS